MSLSLRVKCAVYAIEAFLEHLVDAERSSFTT